MLYIGVDDAGEVLGLAPDLGLLKEDQRDVDCLVNNIRTDIKDRFRDGNNVNDYVNIEAVEMKEGQILQLEVTSRRSMSFLSVHNHGYRLYRRARQSNS